MFFLSLQPLFAAALTTPSIGTRMHTFVPAMRTRIAQVNDCSAAPPLVPFYVRDERVGCISPKILAALRDWPGVFHCSDATCVRLASQLEEATFEERNAAVHQVALALREQGIIDQT